MKDKLSNLSRRYRAALRTHLGEGRRASLEPAVKLSGEVMASGMPTPELAKLHEQFLVRSVLPGCPAGKRPALIRKAGIFFAMAISPDGETQRNGREATVQLKKFIEALSERTVELAASNHDLSVEIRQRKAAEEALRKSERHSAQLLKQSHTLQDQMRRLSRQILTAHEDERKKISRELHDVIAQALTSINVRLATLKEEAAASTHGLARSIARTQRMVEKSVNIVHRFARELRPAVLDDLGLIPALHSFMRNFTSRSGVRTRLTAFAGVEHLNTARRTVLFRVAQEALTNVDRHAEAGHAEVVIEKLPDCILMRIHDDGKAFNVEHELAAGGSKRLGLLGMRERLEMIGGCLSVDSSPGKGTTVEARIPPGNGRPQRKTPGPKLAKTKP
jgi:signal transduction histidine kinase